MTKKNEELPVEIVSNETAAVNTEDTNADEIITETNVNEPAPLPEPPPVKPKRTRKKKEEPTEAPEAAPPDAENDTVSEQELDTAEPSYQPYLPKTNPILTLEVRDHVETEEELAEIAWHEIRNAYHTRRILTGIFGGLEQNDAGKTIAIVEYKGYRILIPLKEMVLGLPNNLTGRNYTDMMIRQNKLLSKMLGCEIDFIVKGIDSKAHSVVASRNEAMMKKRRIFYFDLDDNECYRIYEGRIVQARVIAVAEKAIRVEVFGVECSIMARDLTWDWIGDAHERYSVGDHILVRVLKVNRENIETLSIKADAKSTSEVRQNNLNLCRVQSKYAGKVTDVYKGVVYVRLTNGVNAVAHSCLDRRMPGKKDEVSFAVTAIDDERGVALGIITRIIKQHL